MTCVVLQAAGKSNVVTVINPNSGPDFTGRDATVKCLPHLRRAGNTLIGYVATGMHACEEVLQRQLGSVGSIGLLMFGHEVHHRWHDSSQHHACGSDCRLWQALAFRHQQGHTEIQGGL
jgi:hypothetical protein